MKHYQDNAGQVYGFDIDDQTQAPYMLKAAFPQFDVDAYLIGVAEVGLRPLTTQEAEQRLLAAGWQDISDTWPPKNEIAKVDVKSGALNAIQVHLDTVARTHGYDGILSLCSYASDTVLEDPIAERFRLEGNAGLIWRSACWASLYRLQNDIQDGLKEAPTSIEDAAKRAIEAMPAIDWPQGD